MSQSDAAWLFIVNAPGAAPRLDAVLGCTPRGMGVKTMSFRQSAGMIVTIAVVLGVDMRLEWLVPLAMCCGGLATYFASVWEERRR